MKNFNLYMLLAFLATAFLFTSCDDEDSASCEDFCTNGICVDGQCIPNTTNENEVRVNANITEDVTWETGKCYILGGRITVESGATLTVEPGVIVKGEAGSAANATALLIARGGKLMAEGTSSLPIIFTSVADNITPEMVAAGNYSSPNLEPTINGLWGGIIVLGNAPISAKDENDVEAAAVQIEGIPTSDPNGLYGGSDKTDNSGVLSYISIRHGGTNIGAGNEINGLTLGGVGSGTTISNIEVVANQDDGIEWFGGTVSVSNVVIWNCGDDGLDTDQAWNGTCSDFVIVTPQGGSAFELDGPEASYIDGPHSFENGVVYAGSNIDHLVDLDDNTNAGLRDIYFFGIDPEYNEDGSFEPIESFGGDGSGVSGNWQYTLPAGVAVDRIFTGVPAGALTEVAENANTVGPNASGFGWTWAAHSGGLSGIGF